jgi:opacity protein-like surface antigen
MKRIAQLVFAAALSLAMLSSAAQAAGSGWQFAVSPYLWAINLDGTVGTARTGSVDVDLDFGDIADVFKGGLALAVEARKDNRWIFLVDGQYLGLEQEKSHGAAGVEVDVDGYILGAYVGYRMGGPVTVDLLAGGRYSEQKVEIDFARLVSRKHTEAWADALGGVRVIVPFNDAFGVSLFGAIGAGDSDLTWELLPLAYWNITPHLALKAGYRVLDYDYEQDGFVYDVRTDGFIAGLTFTF